MENSPLPLDDSLLQAPGKSKGKPRTFNCSACGGVVTLRAVGHAVSAICAHCSSLIDALDENYRIIKVAREKTRDTLLAIGSKGVLFDVKWEVVGYMEKTDGSGFYGWEEYLLYNPYHGFRFLVQANGHWSFVRVLKKSIPVVGTMTRFSLEDRDYSLFLKGKAVVKYVKGEFYWRVQKGESVAVADYISPPYMVSIEKDGQEITVALGEYVASSLVGKAFGVAMPGKTGVAPHQPAPFHGKFSGIWLTAVAAIVLATAVQIASSVFASAETVYNIMYTVNYPEKDKTISTEVMTLPKAGNVLIETVSRLDNNWAEYNFALVSETNNKAYEILQGVEYYHGKDSEGYAWSEGSWRRGTYISAVPAGNYKLLIDVDSGLFPKFSPLDFTVEVKRDVPSISNYWITVLLLLLYPLFASVVRWRFENTRWSESDFDWPLNIEL
jgi:hypothetical protein